MRFKGWKHVTKPLRKAVDKVTEAEEITETDNEAEKYSFISMLPKIVTFILKNATL